MFMVALTGAPSGPACGFSLKVGRICSAAAPKPWPFGVSLATEHCSAMPCTSTRQLNTTLPSFFAL